MKWSKLYNPIMKALIRSPLHGSVSKNYMIITFTGRKSGKVYSVPVEYFTIDGYVGAFTQAERIWWRNLRDGAAVSVHLQGKERKGTSEAITGDVEVFAPAFRAYLQKWPGRAKYFKVAETADGQLDEDDIKRAAQTHVVIRIRLE